MSTRIVNRHVEPYDTYIGRGTPFGNPWSHDSRWVKPENLCATREEAVKRYGDWLLDVCSYQTDDCQDFKIEVLKLKGHTLACSCKPAACHGDVIVEFIDNYNFMPQNEGIDHINIYSKSSLELGRMLSNFYYAPFICENLEFASVEAYWYWLKTGRQHHTLRSLHGFAAKKAGKIFEKVEIEGFNDLVLEAIRCKLRQNKPIRDALKASDLALTHYYYFGEKDNCKVTRLPQYEWIVEEFERIRTLLRAV